MKGELRGSNNDARGEVSEMGWKFSGGSNNEKGQSKEARKIHQSEQFLGDL